MDGREKDGKRDRSGRKKKERKRDRDGRERKIGRETGVGERERERDRGEKEGVAGEKEKKLLIQKNHAILSCRTLLRRTD